MILPTGDWNPLGSKFYQKFELCSMSWGEDGIHLENFRIACAPFGGFIGKYIILYQQLLLFLLFLFFLSHLCSIV